MFRPALKEPNEGCRPTVLSAWGWRSSERLNIDRSHATRSSHSCAALHARLALSSGRQPFHSLLRRITSTGRLQEQQRDMANTPAGLSPTTDADLRHRNCCPKCPGRGRRPICHHDTQGMDEVIRLGEVAWKTYDTADFVFGVVTLYYMRRRHQGLQSERFQEVRTVHPRDRTSGRSTAVIIIFDGRSHQTPEEDLAAPHARRTADRQHDRHCEQSGGQLTAISAAGQREAAYGGRPRKRVLGR